jgi:hypothetical protein
MKATLISGRHAILAGLLGTALLMAAPAASQPGQEKWWTPREGGRERVQRAPEHREQNRGPGWYRGEQRVYRQVPRHGRFYRDRIVIRDGNRGPYFGAYRYWFRPQFVRHFVYVRPVRYWVSADAHFGGLSISARIHRGDRCWFGCNFCDERFHVYDDWAAHVRHCDHGPRGYRVQTRPWDDGWDRYDDRGWRNDRYEEEGEYDGR